MNEVAKVLSLQELADIDQMAAKVIDDWIDSETVNVSEFFTDDYAAGNSLKEAVAVAITAVASDYAERLAKALNPGVNDIEGIHVHDDDWESTYAADDVNSLAEEMTTGGVMEIHRLLEIPSIWAAAVPGDDGSEIQYFATEAEALSAALNPQQEGSRDHG